MWQRIKAAWTVLTGKIYIPDGPKTIYVQSSQPDNQFVQLLAWRDTVLALDAQGKIWELRPNDYANVGGFINQLVQESPRSY